MTERSPAPGPAPGAFFYPGAFSPGTQCAKIPVSFYIWVKAESRGVKVYWDREKVQIDTPRQALLVLDGQQRLLMPGSYTFPREES